MGLPTYPKLVMPGLVPGIHVFIRPDQINEAFDRVVKKDVRYRFVIDMRAGRQG